MPEDEQTCERSDRGGTDKRARCEAREAALKPRGEQTGVSGVPAQPLSAFDETQNVDIPMSKPELERNNTSRVHGCGLRAAGVPPPALPQWVI